MIWKTTLAIFKHSYIKNLTCCFSLLFLLNVQAQEKRLATQVHSRKNVDNADNATQENNLFATLNSNSGITLVSPAQKGILELAYPEIVPGNTTSYVRINFDEDKGILNYLLQGTLGTAIANLSEEIILGNHYFNVKAYYNTQQLSSYQDYKVLVDKNNNYFAGITPSSSYNRIRIEDVTSANLPLGVENSMDVYHAFSFIPSPIDCYQPEFTSSDASGISLDLLNIGGAGVTNHGDAIDDNLNTYSKINHGLLGIGTTVSQIFYLATEAQASQEFQIHLKQSGSLATVNLLDHITVKAYHNDVEVLSQKTSGNFLNIELLNLLKLGEVVSLTFNPNLAFDRIEIILSDFAAVATDPSLDIHEVEIRNTIIADAGQITAPESCGTKAVEIEAVPVAPKIGFGEWSFTSSNGGTGNFASSTSNATTFFGEAEKNYELIWTVTPVTGCAPVRSRPIVVNFPADCSKVNFDGQDDYISFGNNLNLRNPNTFTIEAWIKPHNLTGIQTIISKRNSKDLSAGGYDLILTSGRPALRVNGTTVSVNQQLTTSRWYHVAATQNGKEANIYIDGLKVKTQSLNEVPKEIAVPTLAGAMYDPDTPYFPKNFFHGWMEEVRIWRKALSEEQLHFIMNQRLEKDGISGIKGEVLPVPIPGGLSWNDLLGYYRLLPSEVDNGITPDLSSYGIDGELKNIEENQENTAPLPYILYTSNNGNWYDKSTWRLPVEINGTAISERDVWVPPNSIGIDQKTKIDWNIVKLQGDIKNPGSPSNKNSITLLALLSEKGTFDIMGVENLKGNALTITKYLKLDGIIDLNGESQLIQPEGSVVDQSPNLEILTTGYIEKDQQGISSSYNYNYWSSPVLPSIKDFNYKVAEVMFDGTETGSKKWKKINFDNGPYFADGALTSPIKISSYWIYAFRNKKSNDYSSWEHVGSDKVGLLPGEGYTMKGTEKVNVKAGKTQNYTFKGFPNNGNVELQVGKGQQYLIGNPYPSAIQIDKFIEDNTSENGNNVFNGAIYFWDHYSGETHYLKEYVGGYATRNRIDAVPAAATNARIDNSDDKNGTKKPGPYIAVGQGFIINTSLDEELSSVSTVQGGTVTFRNSQRAFIPESSEASRFLKPESSEKAVIKEDRRSKIRLNFESPKGYHRQILLGVDPKASNTFDFGFDALSMDNNKEDMLWIIEGHEFVIQGVSHTNKDQVLPLGIKIDQEGEFSIKIAELENVPEETKIYLRDNRDTTYYNLRKEGFTSAIEPGLFTDRYEIVFTDGKVVEDNRPKIWLNFESPNGHTREITAIADTHSTNNYDPGKDKSLAENQSEDMYWLIGDSKFLTQEIPEFTKDQELSLGVTVIKNKTFTIDISRLENIPDDLDIFLEDNKNKLFHNLRKSAYQTTAEAGTVDDRFKLVFYEVKAEEKEINSKKIEILYVHSSREVIVRNPQLIKISKIYLTNSLGQQIHLFNNVPLEQELRFPVDQFSSGFHIVKLVSDEGTFIQKIILE